MYCQEFDGGKLCDYEWGICGNSIIEERIGETCDDGNNVSGDGEASFEIGKSLNTWQGKIVNLGELWQYGNTLGEGVFINFNGRWGEHRAKFLGQNPGDSPRTMSYQNGWYWNEK